MRIAQKQASQKHPAFLSADPMVLKPFCHHLTSGIFIANYISEIKKSNFKNYKL